jgi:hypothetical protein
VFYSTLFLLLVLGTSSPLGLQIRGTGREEINIRNVLRVDGREIHGENERDFVPGGRKGISLLENFQASPFDLLTA